MKNTNNKSLNIINQILSETFYKILISYLHGHNIKGYIYGEYVRSLFTEEDVEELKIAIFGDAVEVGKFMQSKFEKKCSITYFKNSGTAILKFRSHNNSGIKTITLIDTITTSSNRRLNIRNTSIETFLAYTDFTINALAISLNFDDLGEIIDPYNAIKDIQNQIITTTTGPNTIFPDKPLLILHCYDLWSITNFQISEICHQAIETYASALSFKYSNKDELRRIVLHVLSSSKLCHIIADMQETKVLSKILPELAAIDTINSNNGFVCRNDFNYTLKIVEQVCKRTNDIILRLTALLMYIGKSNVQKFNNQKGWTFHGYEIESGKMLSEIFHRLQLIKELEEIPRIKNLFLMLKNLLHIDIKNVTDSAIRRLITKVGNHLDDLLLLYSCHNTTDNREKDVNQKSNYILLKERIKEVKNIDRRMHLLNTICINGYMLMEMFPGIGDRDINLLKNSLATAVLNGQARNDYESLLPVLLAEAPKFNLVYKPKSQVIENDSVQTMEKERKSLDTEIISENKNLKLETAIKPTKIKVKEYRIRKENICLALFSDGTYMLEDLSDTDSVANEILVISNQTMLLQCYESGYVNKVSVDELWELRRNFVYKNATCAQWNMRALLIASDNDILEIQFQNGSEENNCSVLISSIKEHSMLGLKGSRIVDKKDIISWRIAEKEE